jgi:hypothetical protein
LLKQFNNDKTQNEMAKYFNVCTTTIKRRLIKYLGKEEYLKKLGKRAR